MRFSQLAEYLQKLEDTTKRLEITAILAELIDELENKETDIALYMSRGYLKAEFETERFNIAEKMMIKILSQAYGTDEKIVKGKYSTLGDLGTVAGELSTGKGFKLNIVETHAALMDIAVTEGSGSQERKILKSAQLLQTAEPSTAKFLTRIILGNVRLGFTELTIVEALVLLLNGAKDKEMKKVIENKYRIHPDIGLIAKRIKQKGVKGLKDGKMEVGVPVHAQKAQRLSGAEEIIEKMGEVWIEYKFDGTRAQLHMDRDKTMKKSSFDQQDMFATEKEILFTKTFTRNLEETTHQFPDIVEAANVQIDATSVILDGEAIGYNKETGKFLPFQETIQRKRKHGIADAAKQIPLKYMVFDILYLNGESLVDMPLIERRKLLDSIIKKGEVIVVDEYTKTEDAKVVAKESKDALAKGLEGIMIKKVNSPYQAGARNFTWVKMKKSEEQILGDTVDCVVLGYYFGRGARAKFGIGGFLAAVWDENEERYKTLTKVGSGLKDDEWGVLKKMADKLAIGAPIKNADIEKKYYCDVWTKPEIVVELAADELSKSKEHSSGFALRFPRLVKFRTDKSATDTTTPSEVAQIYNNQ